jgi:N-acetylmuramoyl-L-alanine amidase
MKVLPDHWLDEAKRLKYPAGPAMSVRRFAIAHFTAGATALSSYEFWLSGKAFGAEAHIIIDRDGTVYQIRPFNQRCDHAGKSKWHDQQTSYTYLNSCSIGVEFANAGLDDPKRPDAFDWAKKQPGFVSQVATHKNGADRGQWEAFPEAQIVSGIAVFRAIVTRYSLDDLVGHDDIAPSRKNDPGPLFPMQRVREACGFRGLPH